MIRQATLEDLPALLRFEQAVVAAERPFDPTLKANPIHYYDIGSMINSESVELLVAHAGVSLAGCGYCRIEDAKPYLNHSQHGYLGFMYVIPGMRGQGVNKKIIDALCAWATTRQVNELRLDVYYNNSAAIRAYEKAGFSIHMLEMRKALRPVNRNDR